MSDCHDRYERLRFGGFGITDPFHCVKAPGHAGRHGNKNDNRTWDEEDKRAAREEISAWRRAQGIAEGWEGHEDR